MTSIRCKNILCDEPLLISEDMAPKAIECPKCKTGKSFLSNNFYSFYFLVADFEYVVRGQQTMLELPVKYAPTEKIETLKASFLKQ
jgi:phage FluMu protein Com